MQPHQQQGSTGEKVFKAEKRSFLSSVIPQATPSLLRSKSAQKTRPSPGTTSEGSGTANLAPVSSGGSHITSGLLFAFTKQAGHHTSSGTGEAPLSPLMAHHRPQQLFPEEKPITASAPAPERSSSTGRWRFNRGGSSSTTGGPSGAGPTSGGASDRSRNSRGSNTTVAPQQPSGSGASEQGTVAELEKALQEQRSAAEAGAVQLEEPDVIRYRLMQQQQGREGGKLAKWSSLPKKFGGMKMSVAQGTEQQEPAERAGQAGVSSSSATPATQQAGKGAGALTLGARPSGGPRPGSIARSSSGVPAVHREGNSAPLDMEVLVMKLRRGMLDEKRDAAMAIRVALKDKTENKQKLIAAGGIPALVDLLQSGDGAAVEHAVTALLNLSLVEGAAAHITAAGGIKAVTEVLKSGTAGAKGNAAATLFTLSAPEENKGLVRAAGAIPPLVQLLAAGNLRSKKDAALALFNLSRNVRCSQDIVKAGAVKVLLQLMQSSSQKGSSSTAGQVSLRDPVNIGMEEKCMAVLANLSKLPMGRSAILQEEHGLGTVADMVKVGSLRTKEDAVVILLQLATNGEAELDRIRERGIAPELDKLVHSGIPRMEKYARPLLDMIRSSGASSSGSSQGSRRGPPTQISPIATPTTGTSPLLSPIGLGNSRADSNPDAPGTSKGFSFH